MVRQGNERNVAKPMILSKFDGQLALEAIKNAGRPANIDFGGEALTGQQGSVGDPVAEVVAAEDENGVGSLDWLCFYQKSRHEGHPLLVQQDGHC